MVGRHKIEDRKNMRKSSKDSNVVFCKSRLVKIHRKYFFRC